MIINNNSEMGLIPSPLQINTYHLEGRVTICDKTNGVAQAVFSAKWTDHYQQSAYKVLINGKKLIFPICSTPSSGPGFIFVGSRKITFKKEDEFIKITEVDAKNKTVCYVDPRKDVEGKAYDVYSHKPMEISVEDAEKKIQNLKINFPHFKGDMVIYNRHGVAVFGWDKNDEKYALYWASPSEENVHPIKCSSCDRYRDGGSSIAKSKDGNVNFRYIFGKGCYLNAEPAIRIVLKSKEEDIKSRKDEISELEKKDEEKKDDMMSFLDKFLNLNI